MMNKVLENFQVLDTHKRIPVYEQPRINYSTVDIIPSNSNRIYHYYAKFGVRFTCAEKNFDYAVDDAKKQILRTLYGDVVKELDDVIRELYPYPGLQATIDKCIQLQTSLMSIN